MKCLLFSKSQDNAQSPDGDSGLPGNPSKHADTVFTNILYSAAVPTVFFVLTGIFFSGRLTRLLEAVYNGIAQGIQPVVSRAYGKKEVQTVRQFLSVMGAGMYWKRMRGKQA